MIITDQKLLKYNRNFFPVGFDKDGRLHHIYKNKNLVEGGNLLSTAIF